MLTSVNSSDYLTFKTFDQIVKMTRRSCCIYATGIVSAHLLILGIALMVAQVFQTMIQERIKKVKLLTSIVFLW